MIKKIIYFLLISILIYGCNDISNNNIEDITNIITINTSTTLTKNYKNTSFLIKGDNITFNLNGYTLINNSDKNTIIVENKSTNIKIFNGIISGNGYATGINIATCINNNSVKELENLKFLYENTLYDNCSNNIKINSIRFTNLRTGIYIYLIMYTII